MMIHKLQNIYGEQFDIVEDGNKLMLEGNRGTTKRLYLKTLKSKIDDGTYQIVTGCEGCFSLETLAPGGHKWCNHHSENCDSRTKPCKYFSKTLDELEDIVYEEEYCV